MAESKISCPKCAGHVAYPKEMAGQAASCPHCGESILLPQPKIPTAWIVTGVFALITICLTGALVWERLPKKPAKPGQAAGSPAAAPAGSQIEAVVRRQSETVEASEDVQAMKNLCRDFYNAVNNHDTGTLQELMAKSCRTVLTPGDLKELFEDRAKYEFNGLESPRFQDGALGSCAVARARRIVQTSAAGVQEGWREFKFIKSLLAGSYSGVTKSRTQLCHDSSSPASQTKSGAVSKCSVTAIPLALGTRTTQTSSQRSSN